MVKNATVDVWTGTSDKTLRKLALNVTVPVTGRVSTLLGGLSSAGIGLSIQYSNLNQTQTIATPTNVQPYSQFTAKLQGIVSALSGGLGAGATGSLGSLEPEREHGLGQLVQGPQVQPVHPERRAGRAEDAEVRLAAERRLTAPS